MVFLLQHEGFLLLIGTIAISFLVIQLYIRKCIVEPFPKGSAVALPGRLKPSTLLIAQLAPTLYPPNSPCNWYWQNEAIWIRIFIARQLWHGPANPAVVIQESPVIIAAYASECDAVLLIRFLPHTIEKMQQRGVDLRTGARLLSVNAYFGRGKAWENDETVLGPRETGHWVTFRPYIAEFLCNDRQAIEQRKSEIPPELWERTKQLGCEKIKGTNLGEVRWGSPKDVGFPRSYQEAIIYARALEIPY